MKPTLYVVDDEPDVRAGVALALRSLGCPVKTFATGPELLDEIDQKLPDLRAVCVLDVTMEPMSGPLVHDALIARGLKQRVPVLYLTGTGTIGLAVAAMAKGALDFIEKPLIERLVEKTQTAIEREEEWAAAHRRASFRRSLWDSLTPQQRRVALRAGEGMANKRIADELGVSERMVEDHRRRACEKLGVDGAAGLATTLAALRADGVVLEDDDAPSA